MYLEKMCNQRNEKDAVCPGNALLRGESKQEVSKA